LDANDPEEAMAALASVRARMIWRQTQAAITQQVVETGGGDERLLSVKEAATFLGVSEKWVRARQDRLGAKRLGRAVRIPLSMLKLAAKTGL
jgi:excisionase family DNA binding protein